jgi:hypothetical protein
VKDEAEESRQDMKKSWLCWFQTAFGHLCWHRAPLYVLYILFVLYSNGSSSQVRAEPFLLFCLKGTPPLLSQSPGWKHKQQQNSMRKQQNSSRTAAEQQQNSCRTAAEQQQNSSRTAEQQQNSSRTPGQLTSRAAVNLVSPTRHSTCSHHQGSQPVLTNWEINLFSLTKP